VDALDSAQAQTQKLTDQLSSGVRVTSISDDPLAAGQNVLLLNQVQQDDAFTQTSSLVTGQLQVADSALGQVVAQLNQAISVATAANNGTLNATDRSSAANQLAGIRGEILALANSSYQGQYIFAGGQANTTPFALSVAASPATVTYFGDPDVNSIVTPNGQSIQLNLPETGSSWASARITCSVR
jgi:flagellar hook-associated protein 3 FlgL